MLYCFVLKVRAAVSTPMNAFKAGEGKRRGNIAGSPEVVVHSVKQVLPRNIKTFWLILKTRIILITSSFQNGKIPCHKISENHKF